MRSDVTGRYRCCVNFGGTVLVLGRICSKDTFAAPWLTNLLATSEAVVILQKNSC